MAAGSKTLPRGCSTICLPISKEDYLKVIGDPQQFRGWLDGAFRDNPELFPSSFTKGYSLKDHRVCKKLNLRLRRVKCKASGAAFTIRPSFVLPYMAGYTDEVEKALFLRRFAVPFWGLAYVFGKDPSYWYRLEVGLGRNSIVGTTVRRVEMPRDLVADEHHQTCDACKVYIATVVAEGCCLGAGVVDTADEVGLTAGYGTFSQEALDVEPDYAPRTVNTDGWQSTQLAWRTLFPRSPGVSDLWPFTRCFWAAGSRPM